MHRKRFLHPPVLLGSPFLPDLAEAKRPRKGLIIPLFFVGPEGFRVLAEWEGLSIPLRNKHLDCQPSVSGLIVFPTAFPKLKNRFVMRSRLPGTRHGH